MTQQHTELLGMNIQVNPHILYFSRSFNQSTEDLRKVICPIHFPEYLPNSNQRFTANLILEDKFICQNSIDIISNEERKI